MRIVAFDFTIGDGDRFEYCSFELEDGSKVSLTDKDILDLGIENILRDIMQNEGFIGITEKEFLDMIMVNEI